MTPPVIGVVDSPQDQEILGSQLQVRGWAMCAGEVIVRIEAFLDGESLGLVDLCLERPDVFDAHPEAGPFSGFEQTLSMPDLASCAKGEFEVRVTTADGSTQVLVARQLVVPKAESVTNSPADATSSQSAPHVLIWARGLDQGGGHLRMAELISVLRGLDAEVTVASPDEGPMRARLEADGAKVEIVPAIPLDDVIAYDQALAEAASWVRQLRPDVVIAYSISGFPAVELAHLAGASSWLRIGEYESPATVSAWLGKPMSAEVELRARAAVALADVVQTRDLATPRAYRARGWDGSFEIHREGVPLPDKTSDPAVVRAKLGLASEDRLVLCAASLWAVKGQAHLVKALAGIQEQHANLHVVCVGLDLVGYGDRLRLEVERHRLADRFRIFPFVSDLGPWYAACDALVSPSTSESLSASILEAMAHGKPVIGSDVGGTPELVIDGKTGWLYPAQDIMALSQALAEMATAPAAKLRKMGRRARRLIEREHDQAVVLPATAKAIIDLAARD
ncbi:MAG TPA: glycosyltransferase family 4 protein [Marmoricola sp.]|nr:glycosyltransferase family 4 protein [Nocardioidaceae bacterium]MCO5324565.1 glycosyltransferase family 4 protein [Nocardioidaceae bacterium]HRV69389.1 glycosyltransferase family 4 protein [Marmoricola sp.]